jgi:transcriptional regulator with XRE-family HTH domain
MIPKEKINQYYEEYIDDISSLMEEEDEASFKLGEKIKNLRKNKNLTIEDISQKTGFDKSLLQDIEDEKVHPPLAVIIKLSKALDTIMSSLLSEGGKKYSVMRAKDHKVHPRKANELYKYFSLSEEVEERHLDSFIVKLYPNDNQELTVHDGEEFIYVLDGEVKVLIDNNTEIISIGESIHYHSTLPHFITSNTNEPALILAVIYNG